MIKLIKEMFKETNHKLVFIRLMRIMGAVSYMLLVFFTLVNGNTTIFYILITPQIVLLIVWFWWMLGLE